jgi:hypothetical protein
LLLFDILFKDNNVLFLKKKSIQCSIATLVDMSDPSMGHLLTIKQTNDKLICSMYDMFDVRMNKKSQKSLKMPIAKRKRTKGQTTIDTTYT